MKTFLALTTGFLSGVLFTTVAIAAVYTDEIVEACAKQANKEDDEEPIE